MPDRPPLDLTVEVTGSDGAQYRWGPGARAGDVPQGLTFNTKQSEGFADASVTLARRVDRDYVDLQLFDSVVISGTDGSVAYEGRVGALPRSMQQTHTVTVQMAGWMAHTRDRKASEVYVDRDLSAWSDAGSARKVALMGSNQRIGDVAVGSDQATSQPAVLLTITDNWVSPYTPVVEAWYDAGPGNQIATLYYDAAFSSAGFSGTWVAKAYIIEHDDASGGAGSTSNLASAMNTTGYLSVPAYRYGMLTYSNTATPGASPGASFPASFRNLAAIGDHGLTLIGDTDPKGVAASDVIRHLIGKYCPLINTAGVQPTMYPIPHLVFKDRVDPYDVLLEVNKYHLWQFGVYENRTLEFGPVDMTDYDWEVRLDDPGVTINLQGDSTDTLANGAVVTYQDVQTGKTNVLTPTDHPELADTSPDSPVNLAGIQRWTEITLSSPSTQDAALQIGRAALAEYNQPKAPGTITAQGHIRDRAGHWQPCWKVRNGDRIIVSNHPDDRPRLIVETSYAHDTNTVQISTDSSVKRVDAILDRLGTALTAANLA